MPQRWTPEEEEILFRFICHNWLTIKAIPSQRLAANTPVMLEIHREFVQKLNSPRDITALISKLGSFRHGGSSGTKFGNYNPSTKILNINKLSLKNNPRTFDWGPQHLFRPLRDDVTQTALDTFELLTSAGEQDVKKISKQITETIKKVHPRLRTPHTQLQIVRLLMKNGKLFIDKHGSYALPPSGSATLSAHQRFEQQINKHSLPDAIHQAINEQRSLLGNHFAVHQRSGAAISFSSEGTGSGKSFQANETYTTYLSAFADQLNNQGITMPGRNFCNQLFLAPQKNGAFAGWLIILEIPV